MKDNPQPAKCRHYDDAFRTEVLRLASESYSTQAAAHALYIDPKRIYKWRMEALTPVAAGTGTSNFKIAIAIFSQTLDRKLTKKLVLTAKNSIKPNLIKAYGRC
jgi:transposase-like protein